MQGPIYFEGAKLVRFGQISLDLGENWGEIWVKSKSSISKNIQSPTVMPAGITKSFGESGNFSQPAVATNSKKKAFISFK